MKKFASDRRRLVAALGGLMALPMVPAMAHAAIPQQERRLSMLNLHTGERINTAYWQQGIYDDNEVAGLNHLLRDFRANEVTAMDNRLYDAIYQLGQQFNYNKPVHIISGYRSPTTNNKLRAMGRKVATNSYHTRGMAVDIAMPGVNIAELRRAAEGLKMGGVGYYPRDGFIHLDTGRVRRWG
jgi:uncharacterized protein YcbK (DUF882 family)